MIMDSFGAITPLYLVNEAVDSNRVDLPFIDGFGDTKDSHLIGRVALRLADVAVFADDKELVGDLVLAPNHIGFLVFQKIAVGLVLVLFGNQAKVKRRPGRFFDNQIDDPFGSGQLTGRLQSNWWIDDSYI